MATNQSTKKMKIEQGEISYKNLGYTKNLSKEITTSKTYVARGEPAGGDLAGFFPRPQVTWDKMSLPVFSQTSAPTSTEIGSGRMAMWVDTDDSNRLYLCYNQGGTIKTVELT